jgi:hypothetical protein
MADFFSERHRNLPLRINQFLVNQAQTQKENRDNEDIRTC